MGAEQSGRLKHLRVDNSEKEAQVKLATTITKKLSSDQAKILSYTETDDCTTIEKYIGISSKDKKIHFILVKNTLWDDEDGSTDQDPDHVRINWVDESNSTAGEVVFENNPLHTFYNGKKWQITNKKMDFRTEGDFLENWKKNGGVWQLDTDEKMSVKDIDDLAEKLESGRFDPTLTNAYFNTMEEMTDAVEIMEDTVQ